MRERRCDSSEHHARLGIDAVIGGPTDEAVALNRGCSSEGGSCEEGAQVTISCSEPQCGCGAIVQERNHYFTGKYMQARDFAADPQFICPAPDAQPTIPWLGHRVRPRRSDRDETSLPGCPGRHDGCIDCCGRDVILADPWRQEMKVPDLTVAPGSRNASELVPPPWADARCGRYEDLPPLVVCVQFCEQPIEFVPVIGDLSSCSSETAANRIRSAALRFVPLSDLSTDCWPRLTTTDGNGTPSKQEQTHTTHVTA